MDIPQELEQFRVIPGFDMYEITNFGRVFNRKTSRELTFSPNEEGILTVGLMKEGKQYRRSVKLLVARSFVEGETELFNVPILLDGTQDNLRASNMAWRPHWFAWKYVNQFTRPEPWHRSGPILEVDNKVTYPTILDAAITNGQLCQHIRWSLVYGSRVFPQRYLYTIL